MYLKKALWKTKTKQNKHESKKTNYFRPQHKLVEEMLLEVVSPHKPPTPTTEPLSTVSFGNAERQPYLKIGENTSTGFFQYLKSNGVEQNKKAGGGEAVFRESNLAGSPDHTILNGQVTSQAYNILVKGFFFL